MIEDAVRKPGGGGGQAEVGFGNQVKECGQYPIDGNGN